MILFWSHIRLHKKKTPWQEGCYLLNEVETGQKKKAAGSLFLLTAEVYIDVKFWDRIVGFAVLCKLGCSSAYLHY